jgi:hypothetical protein
MGSSFRWTSKFDFEEDHKKRGVSREDIEAFFLVRGSSRAACFSGISASGRIEVVSERVLMVRTRDAHDYANGREPGRGRVVLMV